MSQQPLLEILRALLLAGDGPLSLSRLLGLLRESMMVDRAQVREQLETLQAELDGSSLELVEVASGYRIQVRGDYTEWVRKLWQERPQKYSRALLETLALICYRQPLTRGDIEEIRGVSLSANILKTLLERGWVQEVGHREAPGRPALLATTRQFLDDFNLRTLDELPPLADLDDPARLEAALKELEIARGLVPEPDEGNGEAPDEGAVPAPIDSEDQQAGSLNGEDKPAERSATDEENLDESALESEPAEHDDEQTPTPPAQD